MKVFTSIDSLHATLQKSRLNGLKIGFVPTMGALHQGHISLIDEAKKKADVVVSSIFVNPTQFNDPKDLERYPRTLEKDCNMLEAAGCHIVFAPEVSEIYPEKDTRVFHFGPFETVLEGKFRPGHFNGVAQVVSRLFDIVDPDYAFFGQKDYQQVMIVKAMVKQLGYKVQIVTCPIVRERDGLAMSSRNMLLSEEERKHAALIPEWIFKTKELFGKLPVEEIKKQIREEINASPLQLEYFEICDPDTLESLSGSGNRNAVALIAVYNGKIRLIDNIILSR